ncbi:MAG TPA: hypothetical protein VMT83_11315 [Burkholderiaceae bacterium]|nr:hypothetical protein [Burkholderiaceae bacterium]
MRVVILCDWLPPDFGAVGQYALAYGHDLARAANQVTLVGLSTRGSSETTIDAHPGRLRVRRVARPTYDKRSLAKRSVWTLFSNLALLWHARRDLRRADEVQFTGSPPYLIHFVQPLAMLLRVRTRYRITDFHPECTMAEYERVPPWLSLLHRLTVYWRRRVDTIEIISEDQRPHLLAQGINPRRIELRRDASPVQFTSGQPVARPPDALRGRRVLLYSGNWGVAHDADTLVRGLTRYEALRPGTVGLWLNATGSRVEEIQRRLEGRAACARTGPVPIEALAGVLAAADIHVICLRDAFVGYVLPSKVYACIDSRRPILYIGSERSDVHMLCEAAARQRLIQYRRVDVGDYRGVSGAITSLLSATDEQRIRAA